MTPVPAHSRHLAGSTAATGGESASAAEALEGADSAAMSDERPNAPAASDAARREVVEGDADAALVVVVVEAVVPVASFHWRACVSE